MQGLTDEQLNDRGRDQARAARERIGEIDFDAVCGFGLSILLLIIREQIHLAPGCAFGIRIGLYFHNCYRKRYHVSAAVTFFMPIMPKTRIFKDYYVI